MTIELTAEDLTDILEQAARYGACVLKTKTTDGSDIWIAVASARAKRQAAKLKPPNAQEAQQAQAAALPPGAVTQ